MGYNYIKSEYATEKSCRLYISKMFTTINSIINKNLKEAELDIVKANYEQETKEDIVNKIEIRIKNLVTIFEDLLSQFSSRFEQTFEVSSELFSYQDKLERLLKLDSKVSEIDMNAID